MSKSISIGKFPKLIHRLDRPTAEDFDNARKLLISSGLLKNLDKTSQTYLEILEDYIYLKKYEDEQLICSTIISREWNIVVTLPDDLPEIDEEYAKHIVDFLTEPQKIHNPAE